MARKDIPLNRTTKDNLAIYDEMRPVSTNSNVIARKGPAKTIVPEGGDIDQDIQSDQARLQPTSNRYTELMKNKGELE